MDARPAELGYRWPGEWEPHEATWLAWPHNIETWPGEFERIPPLFARLIRLMADFEPVRVLAGGDEVMRVAESHLGGVDGVELLDVTTDDAWIRDYGPTFLSHRERPAALIDWRYNAWGGKYPPWENDNATPTRIAERLALRRYSPGLTLEGGAIEGNGRGAILTTASCLATDSRNPTMTLPIIEQYLREYLGGDRIVWLPQSHLEGDDTDGHIDQLARFVDEQTVVVAVPDPSDGNAHAELRGNVEFLESQSLEAIPLPLPPPLYFQGFRLPASYCNFYILNGAVVIPQFDTPRSDERALGVLSELIGAREVIPFPCQDLVRGLGAIHCLTQQQPRSEPPSAGEESTKTC